MFVGIKEVKKASPVSQSSHFLGCLPAHTTSFLPSCLSLSQDTHVPQARACRSLYLERPSTPLSLVNPGYSSRHYPHHPSKACQVSLPASLSCPCDTTRFGLCFSSCAARQASYRIKYRVGSPWLFGAWRPGSQSEWGTHWS